MTAGFLFNGECQHLRPEGQVLRLLDHLLVGRHCLRSHHHMTLQTTGETGHRVQFTWILSLYYTVHFCSSILTSCAEEFIYLFIELYRVTSGLFTNSNLAQVEYNAKHAHCIKINHTNIIRKLVPSVSLL